MFRLATRSAPHGLEPNVNLPSSRYAQDYASPPIRLGWYRSTFPSLSFYPHMAGIVWRASRLAKTGRYDAAAWINSSIDCIQLFESVGARVTIENVAAWRQTTEPVVVLANHMSTLETFALPSIMYPHRPITFVVKRQLVEMPVWKHIMISRNPVVVGRANPRDDLKAVLEDGAARLRHGLSLVIFPQTTRSHSWDPSTFNTIGIKLARRAGVRVVPLALRSDAWGIGPIIKDLGRFRPQLPVHFAFGEPIEVTGNGREAHEAVVSFIATRLQSWGVPLASALTAG